MLTKFVQRPAIRAAFDKYAISERTPATLRNLPLLVPDSGGPRGLAGTAFDFLARYHIARELLGRTDIAVHHSHLVVNDGLRRLDGVDCSPYHRRRWIEAVREAEKEGRDYLNGRGDLRRVANSIQYLARIDTLYRSGWFMQEFRPLPRVADEIVRLLELFDPVA